MAKEDEVRKLTEIECSLKHMIEILEDLKGHYENLDGRVDNLYRLTYMAAGVAATVSAFLGILYYLFK